VPFCQKVLVCTSGIKRPVNFGRPKWACGSRTVGGLTTETTFPGLVFTRHGAVCKCHGEHRHSQLQSERRGRGRSAPGLAALDEAPLCRQPAPQLLAGTRARRVPCADFCRPNSPLACPFEEPGPSREPEQGAAGSQRAPPRLRRAPASAHGEVSRPATPYRPTHESAKGGSASRSRASAEEGPCPSSPRPQLVNA
jgi:hypothetical protein